jgi:hypothetical protein
MDSQDFTTRMQTLTDEELGEILTFGERDGFVPSAIEAARKELVARNLSPASVSTLAASIKTTREQESDLAGQPLSWPARIAFLFSSIGIVPILFALSFESKGYKQKSSDAWKWMGLGVLFWVGLSVLSIVSMISK